MSSKKPAEKLTTQELTIFREIATALHAINDLDELLELVLEQVKTVLAIEGCSIALYDPSAKEFYFIRTIEDLQKADSGEGTELRFPENVGVGGDVFHKNETAVINDVTKNHRYFAKMDANSGFVTRSMICAPLRARKRVIGLIYALNKLEGNFTASDARLLELVSGTIAIAIENAKLYGELKRRTSQLEGENRRLLEQVQERFKLQGVIGSSRAMQQIFTTVSKVIPTPTSVLIQGETGTGKELIARVIHYSGPRKDKPFVAENCGALTETLLESELFGHVKGAFTGAASNKKGLFELAHGGTVFLDEISETSLNLQVKLLRVLQEGQVRPVGGSRTVEVDVRVIASTNRDLLKEVKRKRFRQDLYYRIAVFPITLPPLRERGTDVVLLTDHFLKKYGRKLDQMDLRISPRAIELLSRYEWPGNIRELENEIERAVAMATDSREIRVAHLSGKLKDEDDCVEEIDEINGTLPEAVTALEKRMITRALQETKGNRTRAAKQVGLTRQGLINKIKRYKIDL
jgi:Nif-specific regulatory protein